jgi:hypothetical protein
MPLRAIPLEDLDALIRRVRGRDLEGAWHRRSFNRTARTDKAFGLGLWKGKRWAEYLTVIATSTLIPFEVYDLARRLTMVRAAALVVNVAPVLYLAYRIRHPRKANEVARSGRSRESECLKTFQAF